MSSKSGKVFVNAFKGGPTELERQFKKEQLVRESATGHEMARAVAITEAGLSSIGAILERERLPDDDGLQPALAWLAGIKKSYAAE